MKATYLDRRDTGYYRKVYAEILIKIWKNILIDLGLIVYHG